MKQLKCLQTAHEIECQNTQIKTADPYTDFPLDRGEREMAFNPWQLTKEIHSYNKVGLAHC